MNRLTMGFGINIMPQNQWFTEMPEALAPGMIFVNWRL